ncbi:hypothetical protein ACHQM5_008611 [Ranunculus cassubicifolius]
MASESDPKGKGTENVSTDESLLNDQDSSVAPPPPSNLHCPNCYRKISDVCRNCLASLIGIKRTASPLPSPTPEESSSCSASPPPPSIQLCPFCQRKIDVVCIHCLVSIMRIERLPSHLPAPTRMGSSSCSAPSIQICPFCGLQIVDFCRDCLARLIGIERSSSSLPSPTPMETSSCSASPPSIQLCPFCHCEIDVVCIGCLDRLIGIKRTPTPTSIELGSSSVAPHPPSLSFVMNCSRCGDMVTDFCRDCAAFLVGKRPVSPTPLPVNFGSRRPPIPPTIGCSECHRAIQKFCYNCKHRLVLAGDGEDDRNEEFQASPEPGAYKIVPNQCHGVQCRSCGNHMHNHCVVKRLYYNNRTCRKCGEDLTN